MSYPTGEGAVYRGCVVSGREAFAGESIFEHLLLSSIVLGPDLLVIQLRELQDRKPRCARSIKPQMQADQMAQVVLRSTWLKPRYPGLSQMRKIRDGVFRCAAKDSHKVQ